MGSKFKKISLRLNLSKSANYQVFEINSWDIFWWIFKKMFSNYLKLKKIAAQWYQKKKKLLYCLAYILERSKK